MNYDESYEDYLERILILFKELPRVRSIDIANSMSFSKPSVSIAMKKLKDKRLITISNDGSISLTESGKEIAQKVYDKHLVIFDVLKKLGVEEKIAFEDACKIEHEISDETFIKLKEYIAKEK